MQVGGRVWEEGVGIVGARRRGIMGVGVCGEDRSTHRPPSIWVSSIDKRLQRFARVRTRENAKEEKRSMPVAAIFFGLFVLRCQCYRCHLSDLNEVW